MRKRVFAIAPAAAAAVLAVIVPLANAPVSQALATFPPSATVYPGVQLLIPQGPPSGGLQTFSECTANFVFTNGSVTYIGMAAHCASAGSASQTDCTTPLIAGVIGAPVFVGEGPVSMSSGGLSVGEDTTGPQIGTIAYDSWHTMQGLGTTGLVCDFNDLALVQVASGVSVDPTVPLLGGPNGVAGAGPSMGSLIYSYQNSALRLGLAPLSPKPGISLGDDPTSGGWSHQVETITPGVPGDSGSGYMDASGNAFGVLSTIDIGLSSFGVDNAAGDLAKELAFLNSMGGLGNVRIVPGTVPFSGL